MFRVQNAVNHEKPLVICLHDIVAPPYLLIPPEGFKVEVIHNGSEHQGCHRPIDEPVLAD